MRLYGFPGRADAAPSFFVRPEMTTFVRRKFRNSQFEIGDAIRLKGRNLRVAGICSVGDEAILLWAQTPQGTEIRLSKREIKNIRRSEEWTGN